MLAVMSIEPIITVYVAELVADPARVTMVAGLAMAATALGSILAAPRLGRLADRIGPWRVIAGGLAASALLLVPQALVTEGWQLVVLRFLMGLSLGGLLPCLASALRHSVPDRVAGTVLGYSTSAQYAGQVIGPLLGGFAGGHLGMRSVFLATAILMALGAAGTVLARPRAEIPPGREHAVNSMTGAAVQAAPAPRRRRLDIGDPSGGTLAALEFGPPDRPVAAVFLHANGFNALAYRFLLAPLAGGHRILAYDQRGHGGTTLPAEPAGRRGWDDVAGDLVALLDRLDGPPVVLVGHSMGATQSLLAARLRPRRVAPAGAARPGDPGPPHDARRPPSLVAGLAAPALGPRRGARCAAGRRSPRATRPSRPIAAAAPSGPGPTRPWPTTSPTASTTAPTAASPSPAPAPGRRRTTGRKATTPAAPCAASPARPRSCGPSTAAPAGSPPAARAASPSRRCRAPPTSCRSSGPTGSARRSRRPWRRARRTGLRIRLTGCRRAPRAFPPQETWPSG